MTAEVPQPRVPTPWDRLVLIGAAAIAALAFMSSYGGRPSNFGLVIGIIAMCTTFIGLFFAYQFLRDRRWPRIVMWGAGGVWLLSIAVSPQLREQPTGIFLLAGAALYLLMAAIVRTSK